MKLHRYIDHDSQLTPIDFQVTRSKVKVTLCHKEDTDGVTTTSSERWLTGLKQKGKGERSSTQRQRLINFLKPGETAQSQPTQITSILNSATGSSMNARHRDVVTDRKQLNVIELNVPWKTRCEEADKIF
ncbi:hypothetical protein DPMN_083231 [Dreissena polymorpha]|uniref:Uncharacterized protein n=1 Tax=Dreissena polymorpha TaxID=45954 RepID=A0A9D3Y9J8_DREPO|nr:hypothetical protein DPMN_083231 [Dreissena polymorpha]